MLDSPRFEDVEPLDEDSVLLDGELELLDDDSVPLDDGSVPLDGEVEALLDSALRAALCLAAVSAARLAAARFDAARWAAVWLAAPALAVLEDVPLVTVEAVARRLDAAESAGSCPEASCTKTTRKAPLNSAAASARTVRRMRRARLRIASRRARASALPDSWWGVYSEDRRGAGESCGGMFTPVELSFTVRQCGAGV